MRPARLSSTSGLFSIQRQLSSSMVLEAEYKGTAGNHLQQGLVNINQIPMSVVNHSRAAPRRRKRR